jgi:hypothetical protein
MQISAKHLLLPFKLFIKKSVANYNQVTRLVDLKLMLDNRRKLPNSSKKAAPKNSILRQALTFVFVGVFLSLEESQHFCFVFKLMWKLSGRERLFKQSLLPVLAYVVVIPAVSIFVTGDMQNTEQKYITFLYFTIMSSSMLPTLLTIGNSKHVNNAF